MTSTLSSLQSIAAGATVTVTVPVPNTTQSLSLQLNALYAAASATTGVAMSFQVSGDGTTFTAAAEGPVTAPGVAGVIGSVNKRIAIAGPRKLDTTGAIVAVKVSLQNLDATNAATVALLSETSVYN